MFLWIIGSVVAIAAYEYVIKPNLPAAANAAAEAAAANPATGPAFTSSAKVKVGDTVTVSLVSIEGNVFDGQMSERVLMTPDNKSQGVAEPILSDADKQIVDNLDAIADAGGTADFEVTATGLVSPGGTGAGQPITIGVLKGPAARLPFGFLTASVQRVVRNGNVVS